VIIHHTPKHPIVLRSNMDVRPIQQMGGDHMVVAAAKVSTNGDEALEYALEQYAGDNYGLINYLMKFRHGTPFEHGSMTFFVRAPIFVWREWHRHRIGFSYNEESARYKPLQPEFWVPRRDRPMIPVDGWKPGKPKFMTIDEAVGRLNGTYADERIVLANAWYDREINRNRRVYQLAYDLYMESIEDGYAMEVARSKLPVAIYSSCWVTTNPRALMAFLSLRTHNPEATFVSYPQQEIEEAALFTEEFFGKHWPLSHKSFCANGRVGP
jgi:thymidylate synthase (FAD)